MPDYMINFRAEDMPGSQDAAPAGPVVGPQTPVSKPEKPSEKDQPEAEPKAGHTKSSTPRKRTPKAAPKPEVLPDQDTEGTPDNAAVQTGSDTVTDKE